MELKIFEIDIANNAGFRVPELIDYTHLGLFKKLTQSKGMTSKVEYFRSYENNQYSDLIVEEIFEYTYDEQQFIYTGYSTTVNWYNTDDQVGHIKSFYRNFLSFESIDFGIQKRNNIIGNVKVYVLSQIGLNNGFDLLATLDPQVALYIQGPITPLTDAVQAQVGVKPYMTQQLADNINAILNDV